MNQTFRFAGAGLAVCLSLIISGQPLWAASEHEEYALHKDEQLTLAALLDATIERHPESAVLEAGRGTAKAEAEYGSRFLPDVPEVNAFHLSDRQLDDIGVYENEVALSFPMWLPGEKKAQSALGEALSTAQGSRSTEFRWRVSALLRQQLWQLNVIGSQWELALEQEQRLQQVLNQVSDLFEAGDLSRADYLATVQELGVWKAETLSLEAAYQDAMREYQTLSGMDAIPADISEQLSEKKEVTPGHPALQAALDRVGAVTASAEVVWQGSNARPSLQLFWRGFRGDRTSPDVDALGLGFAVPLGRSPKRGPKFAHASENLARAEAQLLELQRQLDMQLHEARHQLHTTSLQLENSNALMEAATERHRLDEMAFELGEFSLREWLRRLSETRKIERSHELLLIQRGAAIAFYNQAVGESL